MEEEQARGSVPIPVGHAQTVLGAVAPEELGVTYAHEHLIVRGGLGLVREPGFALDSVERMVEELGAFTAAGGKTVVDMMPLDAGRQPADLVEISRRAGVHVIAATGFHADLYYDDDHWIHSYGTEQLADLVVRELTEGMDRRSYNGPIVERLPARAGVIKLATEYHRATPTQRKLIEAYGIVHAASGIPISTHTDTGTFALEQVRLLADAGVPPGSVLVGHLDRLPDLGYHKEVAATGAFVIYDGPSRAKYGPDSDVAALISGMVAAGFGGQLLLGTDFARKSYLRAYGGGPGLDYTLTRFLPRLRAEGLPQEAIDDITVRNPARAFGRRPLPGQRG
jgi:phosphotriesterase-related protein